MCQYVSFLVAEDGQCYVGTQRSHSGVAAAYNLQPGTYREAEWTSDRPSDLVIRTEDGDDVGHWVALVRSLYPTRKALIAGLQEGRSQNADGTQEWWLNGQRHRADGPAIVCADGYRAWWLNGHRHRADGPAIVRADGTQEWWLNGEPHRADGPAIVCADGYQAWWLNGDLHNPDGPAIVYADGRQEWWLNGQLADRPHPRFRGAIT